MRQNHAVEPDAVAGRSKAGTGGTREAEGDEMGSLLAHVLAYMEVEVQSGFRSTTVEPNSGCGGNQTTLYRTKGRWTNEQRETRSPATEMGEVEPEYGQV